MNVAQLLKRIAELEAERDELIEAEATEPRWMRCGQAAHDWLDEALPDTKTAHTPDDLRLRVEALVKLLAPPEPGTQASEPAKAADEIAGVVLPGNGRESVRDKAKEALDTLTQQHAAEVERLEKKASMFETTMMCEGSHREKAEARIAELEKMREVFIARLDKQHARIAELEALNSKLHAGLTAAQEVISTGEKFIKALEAENERLTTG